MVKHEVKLSVGPVFLPKICVHTGVIAIPKVNGQKLGEFSFGQGGVYWKPDKKQTISERRWTWSEFAKLLNRECK